MAGIVLTLTKIGVGIIPNCSDWNVTPLELTRCLAYTIRARFGNVPLTFAGCTHVGSFRGRRARKAGMLWHKAISFTLPVNDVVVTASRPF